ncbi:hypothetical protein Hanom_Chr05g00391051 [Helianthus anomalus]
MQCVLYTWSRGCGIFQKIDSQYIYIEPNLYHIDLHNTSLFISCFSYTKTSVQTTKESIF